MFSAKYFVALIALIVPLYIRYLSQQRPALSFSITPPMLSNQSALILGATGQVGQRVLRELLSSPQYSRVAEFGRRITPKDSLSVGKEKLEQHIIDFENLKESGLKNHKWDTIYIAMGTTRTDAGTAQAFEKIDREYVVNAAREAKTEGHDQRLVYVSVAGANTKSFLFYTRSKGHTELDLASLGYKDTIVLRPGVLAGTTREKARIGEIIAAPFANILYKCGFHEMEIQIDTLCKAVRMAGLLGSSDLPEAIKATKEGPPGGSFTLINNQGAITLASAET